MTLCSEIVRRALTEIRVLGVGRTPRAAEGEDGMSSLTALISGLLGNGIGQDLDDLAVTASEEIDVNTRCLVTATASLTITLPEEPVNGDRFQIIDIGGNIATYPLTVDRNGRRIESASSNLTLNTNSLDRSWIYRGDIASWERVTTLVATDPLPFPDDEAFIYELAWRLAPGYGAAFTAEQADNRQTSWRRLMARYHVISELSLDRALLNRSAVTTE